MAKEVELTEEQKQKAFIEDIEKVFGKHGLALTPVAQLKYSVDNNDYRIIAANQITELQKDK